MSVYRSELAARLTELWYEIERGRNGQTEIRGYKLLAGDVHQREAVDAGRPYHQVNVCRL